MDGSARRVERRSREAIVNLRIAEAVRRAAIANGMIEGMACLDRSDAGDAAWLF
jgi:hypothetical protein